MKPFSLLLFLWSFGLLCAQTDTTGKITDKETAQPLMGANIYVKDNWQTGAITDANGLFALGGLTKGDTLVVSYVGYETLALPYLGQSRLDIALQATSTQINEVVLTAEKLVAQEFAYKKIERLDIYLNPTAKADPLLAVNSLPSSTTLDESANISFRGSAPGETGMFFNNVPLYDFVRFSQLNGIGTFGIFNTAMVDELLVFPGNPPLEYGNTTSGLVAIKTTENIPKKPVNNATLSLASYGYFGNWPVGKKQSITLFTNYQPSGIIKAINGDALEDIEAFNSLDMGLSYLYAPNENTTLKIFNYGLLEGYDFNYEHPTLSTLFEQRKQRNFTVVNLRHRHKNHELTLNGNISFSQTDFSYADAQMDLNNFDGFASLNHQMTLGKFRLKSGVAHDHRRQRFNGTFYSLDYAQGPGFPTTTTNITTILKRPEVYGYLTYFSNSGWVLGGGIRGNLAIDGQEQFLSSQVSAKYRLDAKNALVLALGNYHKHDFGMESPFVLNQSEQLSLDYTHKTTGGTSLTASVFAKKARVAQLENELWGLELFLQGNITERLRGQLSYSLINGTSTNSEGMVYPNAFDLDYFARGNLQWKIDAFWTCNANLAFRQGNYYRPLSEATFQEGLRVFRPQFSSLEQQERLPYYGLVDLSLTKLIPISEEWNIIAFGTVNNLLDRKNIREYTYNFDYSERANSLFQRRTVYFGVVVNF
ncbi:TonB-dependent receptor [Maribacter sp. 2307ULW6-5]|uniref:TonB-dependent receptor n=1 Tax=Maribacter sp. 2307ULW6-5 TaxID=3386275 RepID=UPI0039BD5C0F